MTTRFLPFLLVLAILAACMETEIAIPSFPSMMQYFHTVESTIQLTLSINFFGLCLAGLLYGPLSDSFGRRPILLLGSLLFLVGAVGSAAAPSIGFLIASRLLQGFGAGAAFTISMAMVSDAYQGEKAARLINIMNGSITAAMAGAPLLGAVLNTHFGWRSAYTFIALLCFVVTCLLIWFLPETKQERTPFLPRKIVGDYAKLLKSATFLILSLIPTLSCAAYMAYVACAVFYYVDTMGLEVSQYSFHQGAVIASFSLVSFLSGSISQKLGTRRSLFLGAVLCGVGMTALVIFSGIRFSFPIAYTVSMMLFGTGAAMLFGPTFQASMEVFPEIRGAASALNMSIRLLIISFAVWASGALYNGMFLLPASLMWVLAMVSSLLLIPAFSRKKVRELLA